MADVLSLTDFSRHPIHQVSELARSFRAIAIVAGIYTYIGSLAACINPHRHIMLTDQKLSSLGP